MLRALVELGKELEAQDKLPPPGFYYYKEPIRWRVRLLPDRFLLTPIERDAPRPFSGRTSNIEAHLLADEAGYALGVERDPKGGKDKRAPKKFKAFLTLVEKFLSWPKLSNPDVKRETELLLKGLQAGWVHKQPEFNQVTSKDWVEFVPETGPLEGKPLFEQPEAVRFWIEELSERASPKGGPVTRQCAICKREPAQLVGRIPLGVKLVGNTPLISFNQPSFPSYHACASPEKEAHIGLCFECADTASRAFNFLSQSDEHRKTLISNPDKRDALTNQIALFWTKAPATIEIGDQSFEARDLNAFLAEILAEHQGTKPPKARPTLPQMQALLSLPWKPLDSRLSLDDYGFYLAILSPNVGRIALREWLAVSLARIKENLGKFLAAGRIISPWGGEPEPRPIADMLRALDTGNPNHLRGLLRTAYLGHAPPAPLKQAAVVRLRNARVLADTWRLWSLASLLKLVFFYQGSEVGKMEKLDPRRKTPAYLLGRLLAVLEEAQKRAQGFQINRTLVERFYGAASTAPAATFGVLMRTASVAYLPKAGSLNPLVEAILSALDDAGGFPKTLTLEEQAEFALGFYHQRADCRENKCQESKKEQAESTEVKHE